MEHFPIFLSLKGRPALIVGGGEAAARKLRLLQKAGAAVTVVAPKLLPEIVQSGARQRQRGFVAGDVTGQAIVFAATGIAWPRPPGTRVCRGTSLIARKLQALFFRPLSNATLS